MERLSKKRVGDHALLDTSRAAVNESLLAGITDHN